jgi:uncharacterized protein YbjT (DUF2867 family)
MGISSSAASGSLTFEELSMILITGSTGNIGYPLIQNLVQTGVGVRAMVRNLNGEPEKIEYMRAKGVEVVAGDFSDTASLANAAAGIEAAFLLTPVAEQQVTWKSNLIRAASRAGVKKIVNLSVAGAAPDSPIILGRWHYESEQELQKSGMAWTHLRPYDLARYNTKMFLGDALTKGEFYSTVGDGKVAMVDETDVASVAAQALTNSIHDGKAYTLTGPQAYSYDQIASLISQAVGKQIRYVNVSEAQAKAAMLQTGLPEWMADFINDLRRLEAAGGAAQVSSDIEQVTGRAATPYGDSLRAVLAGRP